MKKLLISKLFPNYLLSKEEAEWVHLYYSQTGFEPTGTNEVNDAKSFSEMMRENVKWFERWSMETHTIIDKSMRKVDTYVKLLEVAP